MLPAFKIYKQELDSRLGSNYNLKISLEEKIFLSDEERQRRLEELKKKNEQASQSEIPKTEWCSITSSNIVNRQKDFVLINASGMGKSTFLYQLAISALDTPEAAIFPVVFSCQELESQYDKDKDLKQWFSKKLSHLYPEYFQILNSDWSNLLILMDGFDQAKHPSALATLFRRERESIFKKASFVITSREVTSHLITALKFRQIRLCLLTEAEVKKYFGTSYQQVHHHLQNNPEITHVPVLLEMLKSICDEPPNLSLIQNKAGLYQSYVMLLKNREKNKPERSINSDFIHFLDQEVQIYLEELSFHSLSNGQILKIDWDKFQFPLKSKIKQAKDFAECTGLLRESYAMGYYNESEFRHQSFQAYFAACFLQRFPEVFSELVKKENALKYYHNDAWREVLTFYVGLHADNTQETTSLLLQLQGSPEDETPLYSRLLLVAECLPETTQLAGYPHFKILFNQWKSFNAFSDYIASQIFPKWTTGWLAETLQKKLVEGLDNKNLEVCLWSAKAFGNQTFLPESLLLQFIDRICSGEDSDISIWLKIALKSQKSLPKTVFSKLTELAMNAHSKARAQIIDILSNKKDLDEVIIKRLTHYLKDSDPSVSSEAANVLGKQNSLPLDSVIKLAECLGSSEYYFNSCVIEALKNQKKPLPEIAVEKLIANIANGELEHSNIIGIKNGLLTLKCRFSKDVLLQINTLLSDKRRFVRMIATSSLKEQEHLPLFIIEQLIKNLRDKAEHMCHVTVSTLCQKRFLSGKVLETFIQCLQDKDPDIRYSITYGVSDLFPFPPPPLFPDSLLSQFIIALTDTNERTRQHAKKVLYNQISSPIVLSKEIINQLSSYLTHEDLHISITAVTILSSQASLLPIITAHIIRYLNHTDSSIRLEMISGLSEQNNLPEDALVHLSNCLQDIHWQICTYTLIALSKYNNLSKSIVEKIITCLNNERPNIRILAAKALCKQTSLSPNILKKIINGLFDKDEHVRSSTAEALSQCSYLSIDFLPQMVNALHDSKFSVRSSVIEIFSRQPILPDIFLVQVIEALGKQAYDDGIQGILLLRNKEAKHYSAYSNKLFIANELLEKCHEIARKDNGTMIQQNFYNSIIENMYTIEGHHISIQATPKEHKELQTVQEAIKKEKNPAAKAGLNKWFQDVIQGFGKSLGEESGKNALQALQYLAGSLTHSSVASSLIALQHSFH